MGVNESVGLAAQLATQWFAVQAPESGLTEASAEGAATIAGVKRSVETAKLSAMLILTAPRTVEILTRPPLFLFSVDGDAIGERFTRHRDRLTCL
jgi:hypothetical protein